MNTSFLLSPGPWSSLIGTVLFHFLWQGTLLAMGLALMLRALHDRGASERHAWSCATLAAMLLSPVLTGIWLLSRSPMAAPLSMDPPAISSELSSPIFAGPMDGGPAWSWTPWIAWAWLIGVTVFATRLIGGWWQVHRISTRHAHPAPPEWQARLRELQSALGVTQAVRLLESARTHGPIVAGWLRPVILIPLGLTAQLPPAQIEALLLHELAHIRGGDFLINLFQRFAETVLFYHPAVWWVSAQIEREREHRCDDWVRQTQGDGRVLAEALLNLLERPRAASALVLAADGGTVSDRIRRLLGAPILAPSPRTKSWRRAVIALALLTVGVWAWPLATAPRLYVSTTRVQLFNPNAANQGYDPFWMQTQMEMLRSKRVLENVVAILKLGEKWSLKPADAANRLRPRVKVAQLRNTTLMEIRVGSEDPAEAAAIADAIADRGREMEIQEVVNVKDVAVVNTSRRQSHMEQLLAETKHAVASAPLDSPERRYLEKRREMIEGLLLDEQRKVILAELDRSESPVTKPRLEIVDRAVPGRKRLLWNTGSF